MRDSNDFVYKFPQEAVSVYWVISRLQVLRLKPHLCLPSRCSYSSFESSVPIVESTDRAKSLRELLFDMLPEESQKLYAHDEGREKRRAPGHPRHSFPVA